MDCCYCSLAPCTNYLSYITLLQFTDTVEDIITDLQQTQQAVVTADPIAAKPAQLREQLDSNKAIVDSMDRKLGELDRVRADADRMIEQAGGIEDDSVIGEYLSYINRIISCIVKRIMVYVASLVVSHSLQ